MSSLFPPRWTATSDNANDIAGVGVALLHNPHASTDGLNALRLHNTQGLAAWTSTLTGGAQ